MSSLEGGSAVGSGSWRCREGWPGRGFQVMSGAGRTAGRSPGGQTSRAAARVRSRGAVCLRSSCSSELQKKGPLVTEVRGETRAKMNPFNLLLGRRKCLEGGRDGERKTRETLTRGVTAGELQFPFLLPSLLGSWHPRAQATTSLGISRGPGLLFRRGCPARPVGQGSCSIAVCVHTRGPGQGASEKELATSPAVAERIPSGGEGALFPVREESGRNSECTVGACPPGRV